MTEDIVEKLATVFHDSWRHWSMQISIKEHISVDRLHRWQKLWIPYDRLPESEKEKDREWARKVLAITREGGGK